MSALASLIRRSGARPLAGRSAPTPAQRAAAAGPRRQAGRPRPAASEAATGRSGGGSASARRPGVAANARRSAAPGRSPAGEARREAAAAIQAAGAGGRRLRLPATGPWLRGSLRVLAALAVAWGALLTAQQAYAYATSSPRFEVRALLFQPTPHLDEAALRERLGLQPGTNILAVDTDELAARIAAHPWVRSATVTRQLPDALIVAVDEHASVAVLHAGRFFLVDREGRPFKELEPGERGELPVITGVTAQELLATAGDPHPRVQRALAALEAYQAKRRPRLGEVHVGPNGELDLYTAELGTRLRLGRGEVAPRLERFDALRAALGPAAERLAVVHLDATLAPGRPDRVVASFFDGPSGAPDDDDLPARDPTP